MQGAGPGAVDGIGGAVALVVCVSSSPVGQLSGVASRPVLQAGSLVQATRLVSALHWLVWVSMPGLRQLPGSGVQAGVHTAGPVQSATLVLGLHWLVWRHGSRSRAVLPVAASRPVYMPDRQYRQRACNQVALIGLGHPPWLPAAPRIRRPYRRTAWIVGTATVPGAGVALVAFVAVSLVSDNWKGLVSTPVCRSVFQYIAQTAVIHCIDFLVPVFPALDNLPRLASIPVYSLDRRYRHGPGAGITLVALYQ